MGGPGLGFEGTPEPPLDPPLVVLSLHLICLSHLLNVSIVPFFHFY